MYADVLIHTHITVAQAQLYKRVVVPVDLSADVLLFTLLYYGHDRDVRRMDM